MSSTWHMFDDGLQKVQVQPQPRMLPLAQFASSENWLRKTYAVSPHGEKQDRLNWLR